jgi:sulfide:quinone oxidoreductase
MNEAPVQVVVLGGGIAGAETMLALRALAGSRVSVTMISANEDLVLPAMSVAEPFSLGHAAHYRLRDLVDHAGGTLHIGSVAGVDDKQHEVRLKDGSTLPFDELVIALGARPVAKVEHATTWWPQGDQEQFHGLLRDLEEGYTKRVAFVIPAGAVWPLPLYELALMTARQAWGMGISDLELTVITPEAIPLALFGSGAATAVGEELRRVGIRLETASIGLVQRGAGGLRVVLQPTTRSINVERVIAIPGVEGPRIPGTAQDDHGFVRVDHDGRMRDSDRIWAAGDAIAYPVKFGGLATKQADLVAAGIAARAGAEISPERPSMTLSGVLMTGDRPRPVGPAPADEAAELRPIWRPRDKVFGEYLTPYLHDGHDEPTTPAPDGGVEVEETLPGLQDA